jgi:hypothetical protein
MPAEKKLKLLGRQEEIPAARLMCRAFDSPAENRKGRYKIRKWFSFMW